MEWLSYLQIPVTQIITTFAVILCYLWLHSILIAVYEEQRYLIQQIGVFIICIISWPLLLDSFSMLLQIIGLVETALKSLLPILIAIFTMLQVLFMMGTWSAPFIVLTNSFLLICKQFLIPALLLILFLQLFSRIAAPFTLLKAVIFLRRTVFSFISIGLFLMTSVVAVSTATVSTMGTAGQTAKRLIEQNIPIIGSLLNDGLLMMKKLFTIPMTVSGGFIVGSLLLAVSIPIIKLLCFAILFYLLSAISEPLDTGQVTNILDDFGAVMLLMCGISIVVVVAIVCNGLMLFLFMQWMTGRVL